MIAFIGVGTNLGNLEENIRNVLAFLTNDSMIHKIWTASLYETKPMGYLDQPSFLNTVFKVETSYIVEELFLILKKLEKRLGRVKTIKYGPRIIDLDILFYNNMIYQDIDLTIPHPRIIERAFVLYPMCDLDPDFKHPLFGNTMEELKKSINDDLAIKKVIVQGFPNEIK